KIAAQGGDNYLIKIGDGERSVEYWKRHQGGNLLVLHTGQVVFVPKAQRYADGLTFEHCAEGCFEWATGQIPIANGIKSSVLLLIKQETKGSLFILENLKPSFFRLFSSESEAVQHFQS